MFDTDEFRRIMGHFATGVGVIGTRDRGGAACGLTANAIASVSLDPMLVLACVARDADSHDEIVRAGFFSINILSESQERISRRFAAGDIRDKFAGVAYQERVTGAPVLDDALAWVDCRVWAAHPAGDHTIFIGEVVAGAAHEGAPLVFYRGGYGRFAS